MYSLLVADDHPLFRDALHAVISSGFTDAQLLETDSLAGAMAHIEALEGLDLLLLDLSLPDADGLEGLKTLRETFPGLPVAVQVMKGDKRDAVHVHLGLDLLRRRAVRRGSAGGGG